MLRVDDLPLRWKLGAGLVVVGLLVVANVGGVFVLVRAQQHDGAAIDVAGRQRMLTQRMTKDALAVAAGDDDGRDDLRESVAAYNRSLAALRHGDASTGIPYPPPRVADQLDVVAGTWATFRENALTVAAAPRGSPRFDDGLAAMRANNGRLLAQTDRAVQLYEADFDRKVRYVQEFLLVVVLVDAAVLVGLFTEFSRRIVDPIRTITADASAVAEGETDRTLTEYAGHDEVGRASRALHAMQTTLQRSLVAAKKFETAVENAGNGVFIADGEGVIEYVNPAFTRVTGYDRSTAVGMSLADLFAPSPDAEAVAEMTSAVADREHVRVEVLNQRPSGERYSVEQTITPIPPGEDGVTRFVGVTVDVTRDRRREQLIDVQNRVLRHNLRSGTTVIDGHATLLADQATDEGLLGAVETLSDVASDLESLDDSVADGEREVHRRVADIANDLDEVTDRILALTETIHTQSREFATLSRKAELAERVVDQGAETDGPIDAAALLDEVCAAIAADHPEATVTWSVPEGITVSDATGLDVAVHELVENGIEHAEEDPEVRVVARTGGGSLVVDVEDTGPGIPAYERAVLESGRETPLEHGSGLGLWIAYWVVTGLGGTLSIDTPDWSGTRVRIRVPLERAPVP